VDGAKLKPGDVVWQSVRRLEMWSRPWSHSSTDVTPDMEGTIMSAERLLVIAVLQPETLHLHHLLRLGCFAT
jgi:hypothetical protein